MHARKKVPKDEAKEKERLAKAQKFYGGLTKLLEKKKLGCTDCQLLKPIADLLYVNPDFSTLWNYRREIFLAFKKEIEEVSKSEIEPKDGDQEIPEKRSKELLEKELDKMCKNELSFIENCLQVNYKSYGCWHHRQWIIGFMTEPDLKREVLLCNQFLLQDDRNFHCWDYRRFAVKMLNVDPWTELQFSSDKIDENFSNFSSWHYRSSLLKQLWNVDQQNSNKIMELIDQDYEKIENAIYTDPTDQSIWFYLRWLFRIYSNGFDTSIRTVDNSKKNIENKTVIKRFCCTPLGGETDRYCIVLEIDSMRTNLERNPETFLQLKLNQNPINSPDPTTTEKWNLATFNQSGTIWYSIVQIPKQFLHSNKKNKFEFENINAASDPNDPNQNLTLEFEHLTSVIYYHDNRMSECLEQNRIKIDPEKFKTLSDLLEFEPDNKWLNYTLAWLESNDDIMNSTIDKLIETDQLRTNYYNDLRSKIVLRKAFSTNHSLLTNPCLSLSNLNLHSFRDANQLIHLQHLDLSGNFLIKLGITFSSLVNLRVLILDSNRIYLVDPKLRLPQLTILSLTNNKIQKLQTISGKNFPNLKHLILFDNPIIESNRNELESTNENLIIYLEKSVANKDEVVVRSLIDCELKMIQSNQIDLLTS